MIEFIRGIRTPLSTVSMPASARTASNRAGNFPSRSLIRYRAGLSASSRSITRFLAACVTQDAVDYLRPEHQQLAMHPAVPPSWVLLDQPERQEAD
jgi:hypothetical protein